MISLKFPENSTIGQASSLVKDNIGRAARFSDEKETPIPADLIFSEQCKKKPFNFELLIFEFSTIAELKKRFYDTFGINIDIVDQSGNSVDPSKKIGELGKETAEKASAHKKVSAPVPKDKKNGEGKDRLRQSLHDKEVRAFLMSDYINLADEILDKLNDREWARQILTKASARAIMFKDYFSLIDSVNEKLGDTTLALQIAETAIPKAVFPDDREKIESVIEDLKKKLAPVEAPEKSAEQKNEEIKPAETTDSEVIQVSPTPPAEETAITVTDDKPEEIIPKEEKSTDIIQEIPATDDEEDNHNPPEPGAAIELTEKDMVAGNEDTGPVSPQEPEDSSYNMVDITEIPPEEETPETDEDETNHTTEEEITPPPEENRNFEELRHLAVAIAEFDKDLNAAEKAFSDAENDAVSAEDFRKLARSVKFSLKDEGRAKNLCYMSEVSCQSFKDYKSLAETVLEIFGNRSWAQSLCRDALKKAENNDQLSELGQFVAGYLRDTTLAEMIKSRLG